MWLLCPTCFLHHALRYTQRMATKCSPPAVRDSDWCQICGQTSVCSFAHRHECLCRFWVRKRGLRGTEMGSCAPPCVSTHGSETANTRFPPHIPGYGPKKQRSGLKNHQTGGFFFAAVGGGRMAPHGGVARVHPPWWPTHDCHTANTRSGPHIPGCDFDRRFVAYKKPPKKTV